jgi:hypothetical protein
MRGDSASVTVSLLCYNQRCRYPGSHVNDATKFCSEASVRNLLHVTIPAPKFLRWFLDLWKLCASLIKTYHLLHVLTYGGHKQVSPVSKQSVTIPEIKIIVSDSSRSF